MSLIPKSSRVLASALALTVALSSSLALAQGAGERGGAGGAGGERGAGAATERPGAAERGGGERGAGAPAANERPGSQNGRPAAVGEREGTGGRGNAPVAGERNGAAERPRTESNPRGENRGENDRGAGAAREGGRGGHVALSGEKRTRFQGAIREQRSEVLHGVDFRVGVGTIIPERYRFHPLPPLLIELVPEYRGFDYIVVDNQIIILEPGTRRIVDIIEE